MTKLSKILLTVAVTGLTGGILIDYCGVKNKPELAAVLPLGAIACGLFMIVFMLEKEMAKYDEEQAKKLEADQSNPLPIQRRFKAAATQQTTELKEKTA